MNKTPALRIGTRGSPLALAQAEETRARLAAAHPELAQPGAIAIEIIKTTGDMVLDRPLSEIGGKGLFTKEIDEAQLSGRVDIAVHSMKDVATRLPPGLMLAAYLEREDPRDALMSPKAGRIADLPPGAVVGTASLRRQAQILARRPDLKVISFRGNVQTRLKKLEEGQVDATLLALAGLRRLGLAENVSGIIETDEMLPAVAQGAIGIACRKDAAKVKNWLKPLNHPETELRVCAERALLAVLDGSCRTPIAALATLKGDHLTLRGLIVKPDGSVLHEDMREGRARTAIEAEAIGDALGRELLSRAGAGFFDFKA